MSRIRRLQFMGSWGWLIFWTILFFPFGVLLLLFNTIVIEDEIDADQFMEWYRDRKKRK